MKVSFIESTALYFKESSVFLKKVLHFIVSNSFQKGSTILNTKFNKI